MAHSHPLLKLLGYNATIPHLGIDPLLHLPSISLINKNVLQERNFSNCFSDCFFGAWSISGTKGILRNWLRGLEHPQHQRHPQKLAHWHIFRNWYTGCIDYGRVLFFIILLFDSLTSAFLPIFSPRNGLKNIVECFKVF